MKYCYILLALLIILACKSTGNRISTLQSADNDDMIAAFDSQQLDNIPNSGALCWVNKDLVLTPTQENGQADFGGEVDFEEGLDDFIQQMDQADLEDMPEIVEQSDCIDPAPTTKRVSELRQDALSRLEAQVEATQDPIKKAKLEELYQQTKEEIERRRQEFAAVEDLKRAMLEKAELKEQLRKQEKIRKTKEKNNVKFSWASFDNLQELNKIREALAEKESTDLRRSLKKATEKGNLARIKKTNEKLDTVNALAKEKAMQGGFIFEYTDGFGKKFRKEVEAIEGRELISKLLNRDNTCDATRCSLVAQAKESKRQAIQKTGPILYKSYNQMISEMLIWRPVDFFKGEITPEVIASDLRYYFMKLSKEERLQELLKFMKRYIDRSSSSSKESIRSVFGYDDNPQLNAAPDSGPTPVAKTAIEIYKEILKEFQTVLGEAANKKSGYFSWGNTRLERATENATGTLLGLISLIKQTIKTEQVKARQKWGLFQVRLRIEANNGTKNDMREAVNDYLRKDLQDYIYAYKTFLPLAIFLEGVRADLIEEAFTDK